MALEVIQTGLAAYPIDSGRRGQLQNGFCQSGPLDERAFKLANLLCGQQTSVGLEIIGPFKASFSADAEICVTGPAAEVWLDNVLQPQWQCISATAGQEIRLEPEQLGTKIYLVIKGGLKVPEAVGSACTVQREKLGGLRQDGSYLKSGDRLEFSAPPLNRQPVKPLPTHLIPTYTQTTGIGLIKGYQHDWLSPLEWQRLLSAEFELTPQSNRMGYRLAGPAISTQQKSLYSEAIALGAMQIPPDGQPIVMMADRQTLGGYPKAGVLARCDIHHFAQRVPGDKIAFYQLDADDARARWLLYWAGIDRWLTQ